MKIRRFKRPGYFAVLAGGFLLFVSAMFAAGVLILLFRMRWEDRSQLGYLESTYREVPPALGAERYEAFRREGLLEGVRFFLVYDEGGRLLFPREEAGRFALAGRLDLIPDERNRPLVSIEEYEDFASQAYREYSFEYYRNREKRGQDVLVVDQERRPVFSTLSVSREVFHSADLDLLCGIYDEAYRVSRLPFRTDGGRLRTAVFFRDYSPLSILSLEENASYFYSLILFGAVFTLGALFYLISLERNVKRPLALLEEAIDAFPGGGGEALHRYRGPREFEKVCRKFSLLAEELGRSEEGRAAAEAEKQAMLADISHDLKTPVTVIRGFAEALLGGKGDPREALERIRERSRQVAELVDAFSEFSRVERPDYRVDLKRGNLSGFLREYLTASFGEPRLRGIEPDVRLPEEELFCLFDESQLRRVFDNILSNTATYAGAGTVFTVVLERSGDELRLLLGNDGPELPRGFGERIFEPFAVGNPARAGGGGSGLGMAIARKIVEAHGGRIALCSGGEEGPSVCFCISLPQGA